MSLHALVAATGAFPYNISSSGTTFPPFMFGSDAPPAAQTPEERRQRLLQVINSALAIVDEVDLGERTSTEGQPRRSPPRHHEDDSPQTERQRNQQPSQQ